MLVSTAYGLRSGTTVRVNHLVDTGFTNFRAVTGATNTYRFDTQGTSIYDEIGELSIENISLEFTNGISNITYYLFDSPLNFSTTEVTNQSVKQMVLNKY
jgi:predicted aspartyl protease